MKVFLYIRVACADQLAEADQREELERYAKDKGYEVAAAVAADGISGVHTEGIMNFLMNEAKRQGIGTILTRDTSRISRDSTSAMNIEIVLLRTSNGTDISGRRLRISRMRCICACGCSTPSNSTRNIGWRSAALLPRPRLLRMPCTM